MPLPVQQSETGRARQPQVEPEESAIRTAHVPPGDHLPKRFPQCITSNNSRKVACLPTPAEEVAIALIIRRVLHESFGEGEYSLNKPRHGGGRAATDLSLLLTSAAHFEPPHQV